MIGQTIEPTKKTVTREVSDLRLSLSVMKIPFAWWVFVASLLGTLLLFFCLSSGVAWLLGDLDWWRAGWLAKIPCLNLCVGGFGFLMMMAVGWFVFPLVVTGVAGVFLEPLADRIERQHYPMVPRPRDVSIKEQLISSLLVLVRAALWNFAVLPLYFVPIVNVVVYFVLNAFLLSREYFQVIAVRHLSLAETKEIYRHHRLEMFLGGLTLALIFAVPVVNLAGPLLATSWMVHRVWRGEQAPLRKWLSGHAGAVAEKEGESR